MQIECPSCGTAYEVPDQILASKRTMRCARCARDWSPAPVPVEAPTAPAPIAPFAPVAPAQAAARPAGPAVPRVSAGRKAAILGAWGASVAVLALAGWWGLASQPRILRAWPASARIYAGLGLQERQGK